MRNSRQALAVRLAIQPPFSTSMNLNISRLFPFTFLEFQFPDNVILLVQSSQDVNEARCIATADDLDLTDSSVLRI